MTKTGTILAIDLGTSGPKVALVDTSGHVLGCATRPTALHLTEDGGAEQDPEDWWRAIVEATADLHAQQLAPPESIEAVSVTAQWAGTVAVDGRGQALHNAIIWMDTRGAAEVQAMVKGVVSIEGYAAPKLYKWLRRNGGAPSLAGKEPVAHILYLRRHFPEIYAAADKLLEPKDYLNLRLTGRCAASYDSIALHWVTDNRRIDAIDYDPQLLELTTLDREKLPELKRAVDILGPVEPEVATQLGIPATAKVVMGTPDVQSAAVGSGAVRDYEAHLYIGTSSWITCHVPFKKTDLLRNMASLPSALPGRYFVANSQETAGACINWLRDQLLFPDDALRTGPVPEDFFARLDAVAQGVPAGSGGVIFTPWLFGERSPVADPTLRASFFNQSLSTTRAHLVRAVLEGVAYNGRWLLDCVEKFVGRRLDRLRFIGGGANSRLWCQIHADVLGREIAQVKDPVQCNARGAGLLAAIALGHLRVEDLTDVVEVEHVYRPDPRNRRRYDQLYAEFRALHKATHPILRRLNRAAARSHSTTAKRS